MIGLPFVFVFVVWHEWLSYCSLSMRWVLKMRKKCLFWLGFVTLLWIGQSWQERMRSGGGMGSGNDPCWTQAGHKTCFQNLVIFISVNFSVLFRFVMFIFVLFCLYYIILLYYIFKYSKISINIHLYTLLPVNMYYQYSFINIIFLLMKWTLASIFMLYNKLN